MRRSAMCMLVLFVTTLIVGCGKKEESVDETPKTPEQIAEEVRDNLDCPAEIVTKRVEGAPVDDIQGVRPGLTFDEAQNIVLCLDERYVSKPGESSYSMNYYTYGEKMRRGFDASLEQWKDGSSVQIEDDVVPSWQIVTLGLPNEERVISINRSERFQKKSSTVEATKQAVVTKYGNPAKIEVNEYSGDTTVNWAFDTFNRPITETSALYKDCAVRYETGLSKDCGVRIQAIIYADGENKKLVKELNLSIIDSAKGAEWLDQTQRKFDELDAKRRAEELKDAEKNSSSTAL